MYLSNYKSTSVTLAYIIRTTRKDKGSEESTTSSALREVVEFFLQIDTDRKNWYYTGY